MLLIMCHAGQQRFAVASCDVREVLPRVALHRAPQSPDWFAGLLRRRGEAVPIVDLTQLAAGCDCPRRLSSRIVIVETSAGGAARRFGLLAERVELHERQDVQAAQAAEHPAGATPWGKAVIDDAGVFHLLDVPRLLAGGRQAVLFAGVGGQV